MSSSLLRRSFLSFAIAVAAASTCLAADGAPVAAETVTPMFGSLSLKKLSGEKVSIQQLRGQLVLLNFWATWCQPCVGEMPLLAGLARKFHDRGLTVVAASLDDADNRDAVARFAGRLPEGMEIWVGATQEDMARLKLGAAVPVTVLIDREGRVLGARQGALSEGLLDDDIEQALGDKGGSEPKPKHKPLSGVTEAAASVLAPPVL